MKNKILSTMLIVVAVNVSAWAADPCVTQSNTMEMDACGKQTLSKKDKELNAAYQKLVKSLAAENKGDDTNYAEVKTHLLAAQRSWVKFRDSDCKAMLTLYESGSIRGSVYYRCLTERTEQRTTELLKWGAIN